MAWNDVNVRVEMQQSHAKRLLGIFTKKYAVHVFPTEEGEDRVLWAVAQPKHDRWGGHALKETARGFSQKGSLILHYAPGSEENAGLRLDEPAFLHPTLLSYGGELYAVASHSNYDMNICRAELTLFKPAPGDKGPTGAPFYYAPQ